jgi:hypothetical protein
VAAVTLLLSVVSVMQLRAVCLCGLICYLFTHLHYFSWDSRDGKRAWAGFGRLGSRGSIPVRDKYILHVHKTSKLAVNATQPAT